MGRGREGRGKKDERPKRRKIQMKFRISFYRHARFSGCFNGGKSPDVDEKDATCVQGMHSFCTGHKTFLRCWKGSETLLRRLLHFRDELSFSSTIRNSRSTFPDEFSRKRTIPEEVFAGRCTPSSSICMYVKRWFVNFRAREKLVARRACNFSSP